MVTQLAKQLQFGKKFAAKTASATGRRTMSSAERRSLRLNEQDGRYRKGSS
jgi:hypothetical protein